MPEDPIYEQVLGDFLDARDEGIEVDSDAVLREHPEQRGELQRRLAAVALLDHVRSPRPGHDLSEDLPIVSPDRYAGIRWAGEGGMGLVYWAMDRRLKRRVALKILRPGEKTAEAAARPTSPFDIRPPPVDTPARRRFDRLGARLMQEVWITSALDHPNVVPIYDVGQTPHGVPFYTMRYFTGVRTLATAVEELEGKPLADRMALLEPFLKLCSTIHYAHTRGVVHRDIKTENVVLGEFGEVVVLDWGLAALRQEPDAFGLSWKRDVHVHRTSHGLWTEPGGLGTPEYMSPEAAGGDAAKVGVRSDVFSLGVVLFEILAARFPSDAERIIASRVTGTTEDSDEGPHFAPEIPQGLRRVCARAITADPEERYPDVRSLADDVREDLQHRAASHLIAESLTAAARELRGARKLEGETRLLHLHRARLALGPALELDPDHPAAIAYGQEVDELRRGGLRQHAAAWRRRYLIVVGLLALLAVVAMGWLMCALFRSGAIGQIATLRPARQVSEVPVSASRVSRSGIEGHYLIGGLLREGADVSGAVTA